MDSEGGARERKGRERDGAARAGGNRGTQKRWSERFTAASIGGAAGSLLSVLSEAAADISL